DRAANAFSVCSGAALDHPVRVNWMGEFAGAKGMRKPMRKVTLAIAMLPLLASAPALAASVSSQGEIQLAQAGAPGGDQFSQQVCNLAHQNAQ
ncbi:hypothetical protein SB781_34190, partial [Paraburkholderia sp. SIMBA_061]